jgi:squalene cyclase
MSTISGSSAKGAHGAAAVLATDPVDRAIARGVAFIKSKQSPNGSFLAMEDFEPRTSALHVVTLRFIDRVPTVEARAHARFLVTLQNADGGFPPYPHAPHSELCATALVYAALLVADLPEQHRQRQWAFDYVNENGGFDAVVDRLYAAGDMTALYLSMMGLIDPFRLPDPHLSFFLVPGALDIMLRQMNAGVVTGFVFLASVTRYLREQKKPSSLPIRVLHQKEAEAAISFIESWLNPNGNMNGTTVQTDQAIATLFALGRSPESTSVYSGLSWFEKLKLWNGEQLRLRAFTNENWVTAFALRALLHAGVSRDDVVVENALDYLCFSQSKLPMPWVNLRREHATRIGGWGFEIDNLILPDTDDTGIVLSALGLALDRVGVVPLKRERQERVQATVDLAEQNLLDMQSDDGGWAGFVWNLGSKGPGPLFDKPIGIPRTIADTLRFFADPPLEVKEVPVEGLTGRVLQGLGANGFGPSSAEVVRAARFLKARQMPNGSFWARWLVGYVAATASVVSGLANCGWDLNESWVQNAIDYLLKAQNADGGWGETPQSYEHPELKLASPSMPPLTGIVVIAFADAGFDSHPGVAAAVDRAVDYLLRTQNAEGTWPTNQWLQIYEPYATYYEFEGDSWNRPVEALAKVRAAKKGKDPHEAEKRLAPLFGPAPSFPAGRRPGTWDLADLRRMRGAADRPADDVIRAVYDDGQQAALRQVMGALVTADEPLPPGLPKAARSYFQDTQDLPSWADPALMLQGQKLFTRHGWLMAAGLFCSSLPQAYCASRGASVLIETQGMTRHVYRRILETAQFVFDICVEGNMKPSGRGIRAAQKVRLMHATVRHFIMLKGEWDVSDLGLPINQEDLAGTLMTFSVVLLDAVKRAGEQVSDDDEAAFLHLWRVAGHFLGVDPALTPTDPADGRALMQAIRDDQWQHSVRGQLLVKDLIASMEVFLPGKIFDDLPEALIRFFTPAPVPTLLGIEGTPLLSMVLDAGAVVDAIFDATFGGLADDLKVERFVQKILRDMMIGMIDVQREGKQTAFRIPDGLVRDWGLDD